MSPRSARWRRLIRLATLIALPALAATGCRPQSGAQPGTPVVLISIDTLRSDHLPDYGYRGLQTPALHRLAQDGLLYEHAYSHCPLTLPSHATLLSGQLPPHTGVRDNSGYQVDVTSHPFLPRLLKPAGYVSGGFVSAYVLRPETGLGAGFDTYDGDIKPAPGATMGEVQRAGADTVRLATAWLDAHARQPFVLFVHLYEPHAPYRPPEPFASRYANRYDGEIATADAAVGALLAELDRLGLYQRSLIVLVSDHGEDFGEHGERQHGMFLYRTTLQVPLIVKLPRSARAGSRIGSPVGLVDVVPTVLDRVGVPRPTGLDGRSLLEDPAPRSIYAETFYPRLHFGWSDLASMTDARFHYIAAPRPELYDLVADPGERADLVATERRPAAGLKAELERIDRALRPPERSDPETMRQLAALGYIAGSGAASRGGALADPKDRRSVIAKVETALAASGDGDNAAAARGFAEALGEDPGMSDVWYAYATTLRDLHRPGDAADAFAHLGQLTGDARFTLAAGSEWLAAGHPDRAEAAARQALDTDRAAATELRVRSLLALGRDGEAQTLMREAVAAGLASPALRGLLADALLAQGQPAEALRTLEPVAQRADPPNQVRMASALLALGRSGEAQALLEQALASAPDLPLAHATLGAVLLRADRLAEAGQHLERAVALSPGLASAWNTLGVVRYRSGDRAAALAAWRRSVAADPGEEEAWFNLGLTAAEVGRRDEARAALRRFLASARPGAGDDVARARALLAQLGG